MKLSGFPYLIQKEILDHLSFTNIFFLSLCSKNTKNFIVQTQKYQLEKVEHINYWINGTTTYVDTKTVLFPVPHPLIALNTLAGSLNDMFRDIDRQSAEVVRVHELGIPINFFRCPTRIEYGLNPIHCDCDVESIFEAIHNHLFDLFGNHAKFRLWSFLGGKTLRLPMLQNIQMLGIDGNEFEWTKTNEFLSKSPCLEYFLWSGTSLRDDMKLEINSRVFDLHTVEIGPYLPLARDVLKYFNGRHAFLQYSGITTRDVNQFLNEWKSGEKFQNLEVLSVESDFNNPRVRRSGEFKELNTKVVYSFPGRFQPRYSTSRPCKFESNSYMVRKTDDRVASVFLEGKKILMGVWNMTEAEFLEKFQ